MIEVVKITHNIYDEAVSPDMSFYARASTRGNNYGQTEDQGTVLEKKHKTIE